MPEATSSSEPGQGGTQDFGFTNGVANHSSPEEEAIRQQEIDDSIIKYGPDTLARIRNTQYHLHGIAEDLKFFQDVGLRTPSFIRLQISILYTWRAMVHELYEQLEVVGMDIEDNAGEELDEFELQIGEDGECYEVDRDEVYGNDTAEQNGEENAVERG